MTAHYLDYYREYGILEPEHLVDLIHDSRPETTEMLRQEADRVREEYVGNDVHVRGVIEFSNHCVRTCSYCGINRFNEQATRYRIPPEEIVETACWAAKQGFKTVVLQSGDDFYYTREMLADMVGEIKRTGIAVTLSVGERSAEDYETWRAAGADRYLLKFETSDPDLYRQLHPGTSLERRLTCLRSIQSAGFQLGSGFIIGLPGQTPEILAGDLMLLRLFRVEMAGIGPFIPHPQTALGKEHLGSVALSLKMLALTRLMLPWAHLPATTALSSLEKDGRRLGLTGGANVLMPNLTPPRYRTLYEIYPHKAEIVDESAALYMQTLDLIRSLGRGVSETHGHGLITKPGTISLHAAG